jgi:hypothetical protein
MKDKKASASRDPAGLVIVSKILDRFQDRLTVTHPLTIRTRHMEDD